MQQLVHARSGLKPLRCLFAVPVSQKEDTIFFHEGVKILQEIVSCFSPLLPEVKEVLPPRLLTLMLLLALDESFEDLVEAPNEFSPVFCLHVTSSTLQVLHDALSL